MTFDRKATAALALHRFGLGPRPGSIAAIASDPRGAQTPLDYANRDGARYGLTWLRRLGEAEFTIGVDHRDKKQLAYFDQAGFPTTRDDTLGLTSITPRLRLPLSLGGMRHSLVLGADFNKWDFDSRRADVPANLNQPGNHVFVKQETLGFYAQQEPCLVYGHDDEGLDVDALVEAIRVAYATRPRWQARRDDRLRERSMLAEEHARLYSRLLEG